VCDKATGSCESGCAAGWTAADCQTGQQAHSVEPFSDFLNIYFCEYVFTVAQVLHICPVTCESLSFN